MKNDIIIPCIYKVCTTFRARDTQSAQGEYNVCIIICKTTQLYRVFIARANENMVFVLSCVKLK